MCALRTGHQIHKARHQRVRRKIAGDTQRPRLAVFKSLNHLYAQVIDDSKHETLVAVSSLDKEIRKTLKNGGNKEAAKVLGGLLAARAKVKGIETVVFDRGGFRYHGRVKALADAAREGGLQF